MKSLTESEVLDKAQEWEMTGFKFIGNGSENNDDDPQACPFCGEEDIFWALWEHPTKTRHAETDSEYNPLLTNIALQCLDCGCRWVEEDVTADNEAE